MQWLPREVVDVLDAQIGQLKAEGFSTTRVELICALILNCDPANSELEGNLRDYKSHYYRPVPPQRLRLRGIPVVIRMASPITYRLDGLVRLISKRSQQIYRHELVGTLILRMEAESGQLEEGCLRYRQATAGDAAVPGLPKGWVLSQKRPLPGARP